MGSAALRGELPRGKWWREGCRALRSLGLESNYELVEGSETRARSDGSRRGLRCAPSARELGSGESSGLPRMGEGSMVGVNDEASVRAAVRDLFASATALASRLSAVRRQRGEGWDQAAKHALAAFAHEQTASRRAFAVALLRTATQTRRRLGLTARRCRTITLRRGPSRLRRARARRACSRGGFFRPRPPPRPRGARARRAGGE